MILANFDWGTFYFKFSLHMGSGIVAMSKEHEHNRLGCIIRVVLKVLSFPMQFLLNQAMLPFSCYCIFFSLMIIWIHTHMYVWVHTDTTKLHTSKKCVLLITFITSPTHWVFITEHRMTGLLPFHWQVRWLSQWSFCLYR